MATSEADTHWREFVESLQARSMHGVRVCISDEQADLTAAHRAAMPGVPWQRCEFHAIQNALAHFQRSR